MPLSLTRGFLRRIVSQTFLRLFTFLFVFGAEEIDVVVVVGLRLGCRCGDAARLHGRCARLKKKKKRTVMSIVEGEDRAGRRDEGEKNKTGGRTRDGREAMVEPDRFVLWRCLVEIRVGRPVWSERRSAGEEWFDSLRSSPSDRRASSEVDPSDRPVELVCRCFRSVFSPFESGLLDSLLELLLREKRTSSSAQRKKTKETLDQPDRIIPTKAKRNRRDRRGDDVLPARLSSLSPRSWSSWWWWLGPICSPR